MNEAEFNRLKEKLKELSPEEQVTAFCTWDDHITIGGDGVWIFGLKHAAQNYALLDIANDRFEEMAPKRTPKDLEQEFRVLAKAMRDLKEKIEQISPEAQFMIDDTARELPMPHSEPGSELQAWIHIRWAEDAENRLGQVTPRLHELEAISKFFEVLKVRAGRLKQSRNGVRKRKFNPFEQLMIHLGRRVLKENRPVADVHPIAQKIHEWAMGQREPLDLGWGKRSYDRVRAELLKHQP